AGHPTEQHRMYQSMDAFLKMDRWLSCRLLRLIVGAPLAGALELSCLLLQQTEHFTLAALHYTNKLFILRTTGLPAFHYIFPCAWAFIEKPALGLGIEMRREGAIDDIFLRSFVVVRRNLDIKLVAQWYRGGHPDLAKFVVAM